MMQWDILLAGLTGGVIRGLTGYMKYSLSYKDVKFNPLYFIFLIVVSGLIGLVVGYAFDGSFVIALVAGYAGGDFLENMYKIIAKKPTAVKEMEKYFK
ncbi:MAG: hypothetical protein V1684_00485 [bacterium]